MSFPLPTDEMERLAALAEFRLLDGPADPGIDRIVELGRTLFDVPIALVSLLDADRQWFKAKSGTELCETPRRHAFCTYTILSDQVLIVPNARLDSRFEANPLVSGEPNIRFYAGAPLIGRGGIKLGSLCIIDVVPRTLGPAQAATLASLACLVVDQIELHAAKLELTDELQRRTTIQRRFIEGRAELARRERLLAQAARMAQIGAWELDLETRDLHWSEETYRIHGLSPDSRPDVGAALDFYPEAAREQLAALIERALATGASFDQEFPFVTAAGATLDVRVIGEVEQKDGTASRLFGTFQDVTLRRATERRMVELAMHDPLTGLLNRRMLDERLDLALGEAPAEGGQVALAVVDLDHFKSINDTEGHHAGDAVLRETGERLRNCVRSGDSVIRLGGDEFALILAGIATADDAHRTAERVLAALQRPFTFEGRALFCGASIGVALFPTDAQTGVQLVANADVALYRAKAAGRGCSRLFDASMHQEVEARSLMGEALRRAIAEEQFEVLFQPKVDLQSNRVEGFEALLRWWHPERGLIAPDQFLELAGELGLAVVIDQCVMRLVARQLQGWRSSGLAVGRVGVNLSPAICQRADLDQLVLAPFDPLDLAEGRLEVEVTERAFLSRDVPAVIEALSRLQAAGVLVAFDDFGTGHASLTHLKRISVDRLKIDRSFVQALESDRRDAAIVRAVTMLGHELGLDVVAEGVETDAQLAYLRGIGVDFGQGYLFCRPIAASAVPGFLARHAALGSTELALTA